MKYFDDGLVKEAKKHLSNHGEIYSLRNLQTFNRINQILTKKIPHDLAWRAIKSASGIGPREDPVSLRICRVIAP